MRRARSYNLTDRSWDCQDSTSASESRRQRALADYLREPRLPFHAWLRGLARDRLVDTFRRELAAKRDVGREESLAAGDGSCAGPGPPFADSQLTPAAQVLKQEFQARFVAALDQLSDEARDIILMRHSEHLTNGQVAELLGLSEPAAGMRYLRALRQLKAVLGDGPSVFQK